MKKYVSIFLLSIVVSYGLYATELSRIKHVLAYSPDRDTLVVFDIDNTLLIPATDLGSDQWFSYLVQEQIDAGLEHDAALAKIVPVYEHVQCRKELIPTEPYLSYAVKQIQEQCSHVICLTARSNLLAERTLEQLAKNSLNFHISQMQTYVFDIYASSIYKNGVIFCANNNKGSVLLHFLDVIGYRPKRIIFVDDKEKNLSDVKYAVSQRAIEYNGLRYCGCDQRVAAFNAQQVAQELKELLVEYPLALCGVRDNY